ncbi:hypothetical protein PYW07_002562 [Mythimna separata]|uniref:Alpha-glucosidase n=1 Tax=Mythimna separata TaxID=271217 RepID=A0AAD8DPJ6_MYTSE|nr:hypothetical protein PYW07_002562 [Mythimna separata]
MMATRVLVFAALVACSQAIDVTILDLAGTKARLVSHTTSGFNIILQRGSNAAETIALVGSTLPAPSSSVTSGGITTLTFSSLNATLTVSSAAASGNRTGQVISLAWNAPRDVQLMDCVYYGSHHWYGGPQQKRQYWPIENLNFTEYSYITKEADNCGVAERYWLNSAGVFYHFGRRVPLFVDAGHIVDNAACFIAKVASPYTSSRTVNTLTYDIAILEDVRKAQEYAIEKYFGKPTGYPDELMIKSPIWSTWARYKRNINHDLVLQFADEINNYGFSNSQFELDDLWEICYGSLTVNTSSFPNMKGTIATLKEKGFRTTMWAHPFLNKGCEPWYSNAKELGYIVSSEDGNVESHWWNDNGTTTAYIDFTKSVVRDWYVERLTRLKSEIGVDGYKFDGGETSWSPVIPVLQGDIYEAPNSITTDYVRAVATFGNLVEVRVGFETQDLPIFVRMIDKDSFWTFENGLPTLITTLFQMNINGYPLVLPDMIGGNGYDGPPSAELFIRWLQANVFMPSLQFSYVPWDYDNETVAISKTFVSLHEQYAPEIIAACKKAVADGSPVNMPIWWIAPNDTTAHGIWDEYLLGETILVAPVVTENARSRDIYLPAGTWYEQGDSSKVVTGPVTLKNYPAPLNFLPFFVKGSAAVPTISVFLVLVAVIANILQNKN